MTKLYKFIVWQKKMKICQKINNLKKMKIKIWCKILNFLSNFQVLTIFKIRKGVGNNKKGWVIFTSKTVKVEYFEISGFGKKVSEYS